MTLPIFTPRNLFLAFVSIEMRTSDHTGAPLLTRTFCTGRNPTEAIARWRSNHRKLAALPHVFTVITPKPPE